MRYIEIDGEKYEVDRCGCCPCHDGVFMRCNHPVDEYHNEGEWDEDFRFLKNCPLREGYE